MRDPSESRVPGPAEESNLGRRSEVSEGGFASDNTRTDATHRRYEAQIEMLKIKSKEAEIFTNNGMRTIALFLAVTGALLKFALDAHATEDLRLVLSVMGLVTSSLLLLASLVAAKHRQLLKHELDELRLALLGDCAEERLTGILNLIIGALGLAVAALISWILVFAL
jgi:hypothetical protein